jgi:hypothetical protein
MSKLCLLLDDAVKVAMRMIYEGMTTEDAEYVRQELEQKCFMPNSDFSSGYFQCIGELEDNLKIFKKKAYEDLYKIGETHFQEIHEAVKWPILNATEPNEQTNCKEYDELLKSDPDYVAAIENPENWSNRNDSGVIVYLQEMKYNDLQFVRAVAHEHITHQITIFEARKRVVGYWLKAGTRIIPVDLKKMVEMMKYTDERYTDERNRAEEDI